MVWTDPSRKISQNYEHEAGGNGVEELTEDAENEEYLRRFTKKILEIQDYPGIDSNMPRPKKPPVNSRDILSFAEATKAALDNLYQFTRLVESESGELQEEKFRLCIFCGVELDQEGFNNEKTIEHWSRPAMDIVNESVSREQQRWEFNNVGDLVYLCRSCNSSKQEFLWIVAVTKEGNKIVQNMIHNSQLFDGSLSDQFIGQTEIFTTFDLEQASTRVTSRSPIDITNGMEILQ